MNLICVKCKSRKAMKGVTRCAPCREAERVYWQKLRKSRRKDGTCPECGAKAAKGRKYCATHLEYHAAAARAYRKAKKASEKTSDRKRA